MRKFLNIALFWALLNAKAGKKYQKFKKI